MKFFSLSLIFLLVFIELFNAKIYEQKLSSVDDQLISFTNLYLTKCFRNDDNVNPTSIIKIHTYVN